MRHVGRPGHDAARPVCRDVKCSARGIVPAARDAPRGLDVPVQTDCRRGKPEDLTPSGVADMQHKMLPAAGVKMGEPGSPNRYDPRVGCCNDLALTAANIL